jgi:hypothetical protein
MRVECRHARCVGRRSTESNEPVGPHEDGTATWHPRLGRIDVRIRGRYNKNLPAPALSEIVQPSQLAEYEQMVTRPAQAMAVWQALAGGWSSYCAAGRSDERTTRIAYI